MRKPILILLLLTFTFCAIANKSRVIVNPSYEVKSSGIYNVSKIELSDTQTRIHIHLTFIPHWWVDFSKEEIIRDSETGTTYQIIGIEGVEFDTKLWMPDSGDSTVVLIFPPLDDAVRKIDYQTSIYGISLEENKSKKMSSSSLPGEVSRWLDRLLEKAPRKSPIDFDSSLFFKSDTAHLVGYIKGYDERLGFSTGIIYASNVLTRADYPIVLQIYPDGRFEAEIPMIHPLYSYVILNKMPISFYVEPGQTLSMIIDWEEFLTADRLRNIRYQFKNVIYQGPLAKVNNELANFTPKQFDYREFQNKIVTLSPMDFKTEQMAALKAEMNDFNIYADGRLLTSQASSILKNQILLENTTRLFDFVMNRGYKAREDTTNKILSIPIPTDYYDFLKEMPLNDNSLLAVQRFESFINRFEYSNPMQVHSVRRLNSFKPEKDLLTYLKEEGVEIPDEEEAVLSLMGKRELTDEEMATLKSNENEIKVLVEKYGAQIQAYTQAYFVPLNEDNLADDTKEQWRLKDSVLTNVLGLEPNLVYDISKVRSLKFLFQQSTRESATGIWNDLKKGITYPYLVETGNQLLKEAFPDNEISAYELPEGVASDVFKKIIDPLKGRILFVDFWATTCGPCVGGIKRMKPIREKYKDNKDFDFIFITDERSSPESSYVKMVEEQGLIKTYRLSCDDYNYLRQLFKFNGIPHYVVIDKNGKVLNEDFQMHNFESELSGILSID